MAATNRKAEFAKFFDLFERLTNRALRKNRAQEQVSLVAAEASKPFAVPTDLALPAIRNLSSIASDNSTHQQQTIPGDRQETNTANSVVEESRVVDKKEEMNKFLAGGWYPFTFKMMLHKLYELEEWARKVKEILEQSREDYKSLSEVDLEKNKKKGSEEECQQEQTQSRSKRGVMASDSAAVQTRYYSELDDAAIKKGTTMPKPPTKDNGKKSREAKVIKKRQISRPTIVTATQDCKQGGSPVYNPFAAMIEAKDIMRQGYSIEDDGGVVTSMTDGDNNRNDCSRFGNIKRFASGWELDGNTSRTVAQRKRALSEAESMYLQILPRKRPYLC